MRKQNLRTENAFEHTITPLESHLQEPLELSLRNSGQTAPQSYLDYGTLSSQTPINISKNMVFHGTQFGKTLLWVL